MMKNDNKKKGNPTKKILPAAGMLALSASMLATSTYAWFTMSREVEVKNIKLTASVPEDLQISLGKLSTDDGSGQGYSTNEGFLVKTSLADNANNGNVDAPGTVSEYWANTVDVSKYYKLGTILPASSTDGQDVFFTPDAAGVGKTLVERALQGGVSLFLLSELFLEACHASFGGCELLFGHLIVGVELFILILAVLQVALCGQQVFLTCAAAHHETSGECAIQNCFLHDCFLFKINLFGCKYMNKTQKARHLSKQIMTN